MRVIRTVQRVFPRLVNTLFRRPFSTELSVPAEPIYSEPVEKIVQHTQPVHSTDHKLNSHFPGEHVQAEPSNADGTRYTPPSVTPRIETPPNSTGKYGPGRRQ